MKISRRTLLIGSAVASALAAAPLTARGFPSERLSASRALFEPGAYLAEGTVFTRDVSSMPVAPNSAQLAAALAAMHLEQDPRGPGRPGLTLRTEGDNIPIYVGDSKAPGESVQEFYSVDEKFNESVGTSAKKVLGSATITAVVPAPPASAMPEQAFSARPLAFLDRGTGTWRCYWSVSMARAGARAGTYSFERGGWLELGRDLRGLRSGHYDMRLEGMSSRPSGLASGLAQIGIAEALAGKIGHALALTVPFARRGHSWPAKGGNGDRDDASLPMVGQWCALPADVDLTGLRPFTQVVARAVQRYGAYIDGASPAPGSAGASDGAGAATPAGVIVDAEYDLEASAEESPWETEILAEYGTLDLSDFPLEELRFAPVDWMTQRERALAAW